MSRKNRPGQVALRSDISLSDGRAPTSIVLLKYGVNESDHYNEGDFGKFVFDEIAAAMVMQKFTNDGKARLYGDWNHGSLQKYATREQGKACCSFVPAIDGEGNLVASDIDWTDDGRQDVETRAYNLYSPAYSYAWGDDGVCRVTGLVNFALVNLAGLKGIDELMAAASADIANQGKTMNLEEKLAETEKQLSAAKDRIRELEAGANTGRIAGMQLVALSTALGLASEAPEGERISAMTALTTLRSDVQRETGASTPVEAVKAVKGLVALRSRVFEITGKATAEEAIGELQGMKDAAADGKRMKEEAAKEKQAAMTSEWNKVWEEAGKTGRVLPAELKPRQDAILELTGGVITEGAVKAARSSTGGEQVIKMGAGHVQPGKNGAALITEEDRKIHAAMGGDGASPSLEKIGAYKERQALGQG